MQTAGQGKMPRLGLLWHDRPHRIVYVGAVIVITLLLAATTVILQSIRKATIEDVAEDLQTLSLALAEHADRSFQAIDLDLQSVLDFAKNNGGSNAVDFRHLMASRTANVFLKGRLDGFPQLEAISVIDREGNLLNSSRFWPTPTVNASERDYFQSLRDNPELTFVLSSPVKGYVENTWRIYFARKIEGANGDFLGIVAGSVSLDYFQDFFRAIAPSEHLAISLIRQDGMLLVRHPFTDTIGKAFPTDGGQRALRGGTSGTLHERSPVDGLMRIKAAHITTKYPLVVLVTESEDSALAGWHRMNIQVSAIAAGCAFTIAILSLLFGRYSAQHQMLRRTQAELRRQRERTASFKSLEVAKEIAERAQAEAELASRAKSEFLANMSHELRTPLNAIIGFSEMMRLQQFGPLGNQRYIEYSSDISTSGRHLLDVINDILDVAKIESQTMAMDEAVFDMIQTIHDSLSFVKTSAIEKRISLTLDAEPCLPGIYADERRIRQIVLNLLSNAIKFTPANGVVNVRVAIATDGVFTLSVSDTGIGIPPDRLPHIGKPFIQVDGGLNRRFDGTGLGLALSKALAGIHGGTLKIESELGHGTTVTLHLPRERVICEPAKLKEMA